jgi:hypothetical protein
MVMIHVDDSRVIGKEAKISQFPASPTSVLQILEHSKLQSHYLPPAHFIYHQRPVPATFNYDVSPFLELMGPDEA